MGGLMTEVMAALDEAGRRYVPQDDGPVLIMQHSTRVGKWDTYVRVFERPRLVQIAGVCPLHVPEDRAAAGLELVTRLNHGFAVGHFTLDTASGDMRFLTQLSAEGHDLSSALLLTALNLNVATMEAALPLLMRVFYGGVEPAMAERGWRRSA